MDENRQSNKPTTNDDKNPSQLAAQREADRCLDILAKAKVYYAEPISGLKLKKPMEQLHRDSGTSVPIGMWMQAVPKEGDVASCVKPKTDRTR